MLSYFNFRQFGGDYLITNDAGRYQFVTEETLQRMIDGSIDLSSAIGRQLCEKGFLYGKTREEFLDSQKYALRLAKSHLLHCTSLHIFVLTNACNLECVYCQARTGNEEQYDFMSMETAEQAVDFALQSPDEYLTFEFQGGEPLLNFGVIRHIVEYTELKRGRKRVDYSLVTNLILMDDEKLEFIEQYHIGVSTSVDGNRELHNSNRPFVGGGPSFDLVADRIHYLNRHGVRPGLIETTTRNSLQYPEEMVDTFISLGTDSIFIRPLTPLGYAVRNWDEIGYTPEEFLEFYRTCLQYIVELNLSGHQFVEGHAAIFLRKILLGEDPNYMELRSPCGGVIGQLAYFFNGDIYTCDEGRMMGEMGDFSFRLGNVASSSYDQVVCSGQCKALMSASCLESLPECCDCAYQPYCGTCPVVNLALNGDIFPTEANDYKCRIYRGMLDIIFGYLKDETSDEASVLKSWV